eukprot:2501338-Rhodomonas_salina.1
MCVSLHLPNTRPRHTSFGSSPDLCLMTGGEGVRSHSASPRRTPGRRSISIRRRGLSVCHLKEWKL